MSAISDSIFMRLIPAEFVLLLLRTLFCWISFRLELKPLTAVDDLHDVGFQKLPHELAIKLGYRQFSSN